MKRNEVLQVRIDSALRDRIARLRSERHVNVSAWLRRLISDALDREFPAQPQGRSAPAGPPPDARTAAAGPLPGWSPCRVGNGWGAAFSGDASALPDRLAGARIRVAPRHGKPWVSTVTEVLERGAGRVVVLHSGRPREGGR